MAFNYDQRPMSKRARQDDSIMATNNSSIVSKRSVERLYYPNQPHFFRHFVKKPQRRSPLINRGYWLRMYAIETVIKQFLDESSDKKKVIMNLGCGYDPLALQWLSKHPEKCRNATFVDIDYPQLIARKLEVISQTPELQDLLNLPSISVGKDDTPWRGKQYMALGCDLADINKLSEFLENETDLESSLILCIAEVSVTYMDVAAADSLIRWASRYNDIRFCLLEQILPNGEDFPFAQKMIQHFKKLETPLQSVKKYPGLADQERRFRDAGWSSATARSLWDLWSDSSFISSTQRLALNSVEPFDEWEEFALFASHYSLLVATQTSNPWITASEQHPIYIMQRLHSAHTLLSTESTVDLQSTRQHAEPLTKTDGQRRFGAVLPISQDVVAHHGGLGSQRRLASVELYRSSTRVLVKANLPPPMIEPRMCHTITTLDGDYCLLFGGRTSPDRALSDCWLYSEATWDRVANAPTPLYRHCATTVSIDAIGQGILVYGGKSTGGMVMNDWYLWHISTGWAKLSVSGAQIRPRFGAVMASNDLRQGFLLGGMAEDGVVLSEIWNWSLHDFETGPVIELTCGDERTGLATGHLSVVGRFGSCLTWSSAGLLLVGGITKEDLLPQKLDVLCLCENRISSRDQRSNVSNPVAVDFTSKCRLALLVGHCVFASKDSLIIFGGGAVCFSFGTYWNQYIWTLQIQSNKQTSSWALDKNMECLSPVVSNDVRFKSLAQTDDSKPRNGQATEAIERTHVKSSNDFERRLRFSKPFIMEHLDLGPCVTEWTLENLETKIGADRLVVVHEANDQHMDFRKKNFSYATKPFGAFVSQIKGGAKQYLRSLAAEQPAVKPADITTDFPPLQPDFKLPHQLSMVEQNAHSAPLRISGPVTMWLHYDVMANVLCQIRGMKQILLYPPSDVLHLDIPHGGSSSSINVFDADAASNYPSLQHTHPYASVLLPGDVLYIPPLWLHTASPTESLSVSVNVFFRNLESGYAAGRDVYGNRDLQAYENGRRDVDKIAQAFVGLPREMGQFYLERLAEELHQKSLTHPHA